MIGFDWDADLADDRREALVDNLARLVVRRKLEVPAVLFLEMHKPLSYLAGQSLILGSGVLAPLFGPARVQSVAKFLQSRDNVDRLIQRIEQMSNGTR